MCSHDRADWRDDNKLNSIPTWYNCFFLFLFRYDKVWRYSSAIPRIRTEKEIRMKLKKKDNKLLTYYCDKKYPLTKWTEILIQISTSLIFTFVNQTKKNTEIYVYSFLWNIFGTAYNLDKIDESPGRHAKSVSFRLNRRPFG